MTTALGIDNSERLGIRFIILLCYKKFFPAFYQWYNDYGVELALNIFCFPSITGILLLDRYHRADVRQQVEFLPLKCEVDHACKRPFREKEHCEHSSKWNVGYIYFAETELACGEMCLTMGKIVECHVDKQKEVNFYILVPIWLILFCSLLSFTQSGSLIS